MKSLLLVAHGSRRVESNTEIGAVAAALQERLQNRFAATRHAFLELAEPSIPEAIDALVADGSGEILILPYFLSAGRHVYEDIPAIISAKKQQHAHVAITVAPYLGEVSDIIDVLANLARQIDE